MLSNKKYFPKYFKPGVLNLEVDVHDYSVGEKDQDPVGFGLLPSTDWSKMSTSPLPYQGKLPSCVACTICYLMALDQGGGNFFSSPYLFFEAKHSKNGMSVREALDFTKDNGTIKNSLYPESLSLKGYDYLENDDKRMLLDSVTTRFHKIKEYTIDQFAGNREKFYEALDKALEKGPVGAVVGGTNKGWAVSQANPIAKAYSQETEWYHSVSIVRNRLSKIGDYLGLYRFGNWWSKKWGQYGFGYLEKDYPIHYFYTLSVWNKEITEKRQPKLLKIKGEPAIYLVINGIASPIISENFYFDFTKDPLWKCVHEVSKEDFDYHVKTIKSKLLNINELRKTVNNL